MAARRRLKKAPGCSVHTTVKVSYNFVVFKVGYNITQDCRNVIYNVDFISSVYLFVKHLVYD